MMISCNKVCILYMEIEELWCLIVRLCKVAPNHNATFTMLHGLDVKKCVSVKKSSTNVHITPTWSRP